MEILVNIIGILIVLVAFPYALQRYNNKHANHKIEDIERNFALHFYKILNKRCSIKRLSHFDFVDRNLMFEKCNVLVADDFIIIQGIQALYFSSIVRNFMVAKQPTDLIKTFYDWEIIKPLKVELNVNETEFKIVFRPLKSISSSDYSLIVSGLSKQEFEKVEKIKSYC